MIFTSIACAAFAALISLTNASPSGPAPVPPRSNGKNCTVHALGNQKDDTPQILRAFEDCNNGGTVIFPAHQNYWIATKLNPVISDVTIEWRGIWTLSNDLNYWRNNAYPIAFQNHHAGFIITGDRIQINGYGTGGINGNGNSWYNVEKGNTRPGRPMPFVFWNTTDVFVEHFFVRDSPLWALNIMNGTNMWFDDIYNNATAVNAPFGQNWVQNTDGFDTMDANNIKLTNVVYQGGDDCIAIKPRSYNIFVQNITCHGGNGIAIGSLGQYLENSSVENVTVDKANIITNNNDMHNSAYIKTWMGGLVSQNNYESAGLPRGGGWGVVRNIVFSNFNIAGASSGPNINEDSGDNGNYVGTSKLEISNIAFVNFTGYITTQGRETATISCSKVYPCYNISFQGIDLATKKGGVPENATGSCQFVANKGVSGMTGNGC